MDSRDSGRLVRVELRSFACDLVLPEGTDILCRAEPPAVRQVEEAVRTSLREPIGSRPLAALCREKVERELVQEGGRVVVVLSDPTRPVPYRGEDNILWPLLSELLEAGVPPSSLLLLVATGMHRVLEAEEMWAMVDPRIRDSGIEMACHDASDWDSGVWVGRTASGTDVYMDRRYVGATLRILTGLVEPHSMAGASGGRKSLCPGLVDLRTVREFHAPEIVSHPLATDLVLEGNPCHEVALEVARMAPPDFILNVTLRRDGRVAGVFAGDMERAHKAAVEHLRSFAAIPLPREYDVVVTHGGMAGVSYYQAEKAMAMAARAAREQGYIVMVADTIDPDPVGSSSYRRLLGELGQLGPEGFVRKIIASKDHVEPDQWAVQMRTKFLVKVPKEHLFYFSPQTAPEDYPLITGIDTLSLLAGTESWSTEARVAEFVSRAVSKACADSRLRTGRPPAVAYLADGPYGILTRTAVSEEEKGCLPSM